MALQRSLSDDSRSEQRSLSILPSVIDEYLLDLKLDNESKWTRDTYKSRLKVLCQYLISQKLSLNTPEISKTIIKHFLGYLQGRINRYGQPLKDTTVNAYYRMLSAFFKWCKKEEIIQDNPMLGIDPPKFTPPDIRPFTYKDISSLLLLCAGSTYLEIRNKAIVLIALDTGMRLSELADMIMDNFDLETGYITVLGKGKKRRLVHMGVNTRKTLIRYLRHRDLKYKQLWQTEERMPITRSGIAQAIQSLCRRANIRDARGSPHTFRHSTAMFSLRNGADIRDVQKLLGHTKLKTTEIYLNLYDSEMAAEKHKSFSPVDNLDI